MLGARRLENLERRPLASRLERGHPAGVDDELDAAAGTAHGAAVLGSQTLESRERSREELPVLPALRTRRHLLRREFIDKVMAEHARAEATPYDGLVWDLMMLELWLDSHPL